MSALLVQLLFTAFALAVPATASLFVHQPVRPRVRAGYRVLLAAGLVAGAALVGGALGGAGAWRSLVVAVVLALAVVAFGPSARPWTMRGLLAWSLTIVAGAAYLGYVALWMAQAHLGAASLAGGVVLWLLELFVYVLALGYLWEIVDVLARWDWRRRAELRREVERPAGASRRPFVSLHVPTHNEPPDLVIGTLRALLELDYDDFEVLVLDNNTDDPQLWRPVEQFCRNHERLGFFHLEDWPGYKSGALNFGLEKVDPRTEVVGVIDADYVVEPDFLARCVPLFDDPGVAFVQTPQDYREWEVDPYFRRLYHSYAYFFDVSQRSRNERNGAIFGGTMGLIRRRALVDVGGWDEWCITEDAELSLRLLRAGWSGTHVEQSFGRGIMPLTFEALKRQRFRWCFGGVQLLRMHWRSLLPGRRTADNALTLGQRWAYLAGGLQWFGDLAGLLFTGFLLLGALDLFAGDGLVVRRFSAPLLVVVLGLVLLGSVRSVALLRRTAHIGWREAVGALGLWLALGWVVALASVRGLVAREGVFLRTPKVRGEVTWRHSLRGNLVESVLALLCAAGAVAGFATAATGAVGGFVVGFLLLLQGAGYAAAPVNSLAAVRADLTPELRRRRRETLLSWTRVSPGVRRWGVGPLVATAVAAAGIVLLAGPVGAPRLGGLPGHARPETSGTHLTPQHLEPKTSRSSGPTLTPLSPLSPLSASPVQVLAVPSTTPSTTLSARPVAATTTLRPTPTTRPTAAPTTPTAVPTSAPTQATTTHGRPTTAPTKPTPTKGAH
ncbi:MAG TPA: glycosyltransferase [Marmoricola sp.]|nr:glycosyltransferase [Marmoricola sp.]